MDPAVSAPESKSPPAQGGPVVSVLLSPANLTLLVTVPVTVGFLAFGSLNESSAEGYWIVAPAVTWLLAHVIAWIQRRVDTLDIGPFGAQLRALIVVATPLWLFAAILASQAASQYPGLSTAQTMLGYLSLGAGLTWVVLGSWGAWRHARRTRDLLEETVKQSAEFNDLLASAERSRFLDYRRVIFVDVVSPLKRIEASWESASNEELARRLEVLTQTVMRPLAHQLHPVTLRVGLIQAVRSLGTQYRVTADDVVLDRDQRTRLVDSSVSPQVFRWIRNLEPENGPVLVHFEMDAGDLAVTAKRVRSARALDPIQQVAGLVVEQLEEGTLRLLSPGFDSGRSPLQTMTSPRRKASSTVRSRYAAWTRPPAIDVLLIIYIGLVSSAVFSLVRREQAGVELPFVTLISVLTPALVALPLTKVPIREGTRKGARTVVALWIGLAVIAGVLTNAVLLLRDPTSSLILGNALRFLGSIIRYGLVAPAFILTRGLVAEALADQHVLRRRKMELVDARATLLSKADDTDRFLAEALHRNVQGKITTIALLLRLDRRDEAAHEFRTLTRRTLVALEDRLGAWMNDELLASGAAGETDHDLVVTGNVDWRPLERENPLLTERLKRAVEEISVNALRHGNASTIDVQVTREGNELTLTCSDDGSGPNGASTPGLGSALLDEICFDYRGTWSIDRRLNRTCVTLRVDVKAGATPTPSA